MSPNLHPLFELKNLQTIELFLLFKYIILLIKFIILSERAYIENDLHNVLICGESNKEHVKKGKFNPDYYIVTTFSGNHYQLVEYKDKRIFKFFEIKEMEPIVSGRNKILYE